MPKPFPRADRVRPAAWFWAVLLAAGLLSCAQSAPSSGGGESAGGAETVESAEQMSLRLAALVPEDPRREARWSALPSVSAGALGIPANGVTDAGPQLQAALDALRDGGTLVLGPGTYLHNQCLRVVHPNVRILGQGGTLRAGNPEKMCVLVDGDGFEMNGVVLIATPDVRRTTLEQARIAVRGSSARIVNNTVDGAAAAAIWMHGARDFVVSGNRVRNSLADGIHLSDGARSGRISANTVSATYDDGISVVSYQSGQRCQEVLVEGNDVSGVQWGRGISVVGSTQVLVRSNRIDSIARAAGVLVAQEWSFQTFAASQVVVSGNRISRVAVGPLPAGTTQTGHASIELNSSDFAQGAWAVTRVSVAGNVVSDSPAPGVRLLGQACDIEIGENGFERVSGTTLDTSGAVCVAAGNACRSTAARVVGPRSTTYCASGSNWPAGGAAVGASR